MNLGILLTVVYLSVLQADVVKDSFLPHNKEENYNTTGLLVRPQRAVTVTGAHVTFELYRNWLIAVVGIGLIWFAIALISSTIFLSGMGTKTKMGHIYDGCTSSTVNYKYIVKLAFGRRSKNYPDKTTYVMVDFLDDQKHFITRISIPPIWMSKSYATVDSTPRKKVRATKFLLNRNQALRDIRYVRIAHDCSKPVGQFLQIYYIEIKDLVANMVTTTSISKYITCITPDTNSEYQVFEAQPPAVGKSQKDLFVEGITPSVTRREFALFYAFATNLCCLTVLMAPFFFDISTTGKAMANMTVSTIISVAATSPFVYVYKNGIKKQYAANHGTGAWNYVRLTYLAAVLALGLALAVTATLFATSMPTSDVYSWTMACILLAVLFAVVPVIVVLIFNYPRVKNVFKKTQENSLTSKDQQTSGLSKVSSIVADPVMMQVPLTHLTVKEIPRSRERSKRSSDSEKSKIEKSPAPGSGKVKKFASKLSNHPLVVSKHASVSKVKSKVGKSPKDVKGVVGVKSKKGQPQASGVKAKKSAIKK